MNDVGPPDRSHEDVGKLVGLSTVELAADANEVETDGRRRQLGIQLDANGEGKRRLVDTPRPVVGQVDDASDIAAAHYERVIVP